MEKRVVLAMVLSLALIVGYSWLASLYAPPPGNQTAVETGTTTPVTGTPGAAPEIPEDDGADPVPPPPQGEEAVTEAPPATEHVETERLRLTVTSAGAALTQADAWGCVYHEPGDPDAKGDPGQATEWFEGAPGFGAVDLYGAQASLGTRHWEIARDGQRIVATMDVPSMNVRLRKTYEPSSDPAAPYHVILTVEAEALPSATRTRQTTLEVVGPWFRRSPLPQPEDGVLVALEGEEPEYELPSEIAEWLAETPGYEQTAPEGVRWVGMRSDFHLGAIEGVEALPSGTSIGFHVAKRMEDGEPVTSAAAALRVPFLLPGPGQTERMRFRLFAGPNSRPLLAEEGSPYASLADAPANRRFLGIGFGPIEALLGWLLKLLASTGMGYGLAVVCLTVFVRGALFPLSRKSQVSMRVHAKKMGAIKPKMDAIKKKYKDPKKAQEMTMKLMREEKVSPLPGGCLLAFVQMPIWISLYGILQTTYEMRHASFLWAHDLTGPDHLLHMPFLADVPLLPEWLNLFPILMMVTWGISAHMQPLPEDPQQKQTAKIMRWMPMMFGLILYNYASGLTIYMTCSALWSICEVQVIRRVWLKKLDLV